MEKSTGYRRDSGTRKFVAVWLIIAASVFLIWGIGLIVVVKALSEYESVQPEYAAEGVFREYFRDADAAQMVNYCGDNFATEGQKTKASEYLSTLLEAGELSYRSIFSTDQTTRSYAVTAGENTVGTFTLEPGEKTTKLTKQQFWQLKSITLNLKGVYGVSVYAPKIARVTVGDRVLTEADIKGEEVLLAPEPYFPEDDDDFRTMVNYVVEGLYSQPQVKVCAPGPDGAEYQLIYDETNNAYDAEYGYRVALANEYNASVKRSDAYAETAEKRRQAEIERLKLEEEERRRQEQQEYQRISESIRADYENFIVTAGEQYNRFIYYVTTDKVKNNTKVYFKSGTRIYRYVANGPSDGGYYNWADYYVDKIDFQNVKTGNYEWADDGHTKFKCRVEMDVVMNGHNRATYVYSDLTEHFDMIMYVDISGVSPLIYEMLTPESDAAQSAP